MKVECVVLDWSGVVNDDSELVWKSCNAVLRHYGKMEMTFDEFKRDFFLPYMEFYKQRFGLVDDVEKIRAVYFEEYNKHKSKILPGAVETLKKLRDKGVILAVFSAQRQQELSREAEEFGIAKYFDVLEGSIVDKREWLESFVKRLGLHKNEVIFAGDMIHDIEAGKKAGVKTAGVLGGYGTREQLVSAKPDYLLEALVDLTNLI
jgi:phosphoglycolate phosphatase